MIDVRNTDTINGRDSARQASLWMSYGIGFLALFFIIEEILIALIRLGFGKEASVSFAPYLLPVTCLCIGGILASFHKLFWVNPTGNKVQATINMLAPGQLEDGGTLFIVYTAGFALKWPWERLNGEEIDIEREKIESTKDFTITVDQTALTIEVSIAWRPHMKFLSSYLQNGTDVLKQIVSKCKQYVEEESSEYDDVDEVRANQGTILEKVRIRLQKFADWLGVQIFDLAMSKCDYDSKTQERLNKRIETRIISKMVKDLVKDNPDLSPEKAGELAALFAEVKGVEIKRNILEVVATPEVAKAIENAGPAIQALLMAKTASGNKS